MDNDEEILFRNDIFMLKYIFIVIHEFSNLLSYNNTEHIVEHMWLHLDYSTVIYLYY